MSLDAGPVTPLASAIKMAKAFGNKSATLLVQEGFGHSTMAHPSLCTAKVIRDYFVEGKLPTPGTRCKPEPGYIFPDGNIGRPLKTVSREDLALLEAMERIAHERAAVHEHPSTRMFF